MAFLLIFLVSLWVATLIICALWSRGARFRQESRYGGAWLLALAALITAATIVINNSLPDLAQVHPLEFFMVDRLGWLRYVVFLVALAGALGGAASLVALRWTTPITARVMLHASHEADRRAFPF